MRLKMYRMVFLGLLGTLWVTTCRATPKQPPAAPPLAETLTLYGWVGYLPQSILDAYSQKHGVVINYVTYGSQEEAIANLRAGQQYDVIMMGSEHIPNLVQDGLLAKINYHNVPNFKNISANFRDLAYDPGNKHSVMIEWGVVGLVVRTDLAGRAITQWADLWDTQFAGKAGVWPLKRDLMGISLKSLGYSANSQSLPELTEAEQLLLQLKQNTFFIDLNLATGTSYLLNNQAVLIHGWSFDFLEAHAQNPDIAFVIPAEGALLWADNIIIPANSASQSTAEHFLNFLLQPGISAQITNEIYVATPNEAALPFIKPEIRDNPAIFPPNSSLKNAEIILALPPETQKLYDNIWQRFTMNLQIKTK